MSGELSLPALRAAFRSGSLTPRGLIAGLQSRAAALNPEFHLYIELLSPAQLEPYLRALESRDPASLPLYGIPFAIKDNIDLAGATTTAACPAYAYAPAQSAHVVQRLVQLGAIPTGKTNLDQFATGLNGLRSPYGECRNSVLADYPSGGSSSGSALAVALGVASFALGTDTAGSGRVPAALNGLVGCKPTRGIVSTGGVVPCCPSLDCVSLLTHTAADAAELLALIAQFDAAQPFSRRNPVWNRAAPAGRLAGFRFGVPRPQDRAWLGCDEGPALFAQAQARLERLGGTAVELDFAPFLSAARMLYEPAGAAERYASFGAILEQEDAVLPVIRAIVAAGDGASAADRVHAAQQLQALKQQCDQMMESVDLVLTPTIPRAATIRELHAEPILRNSELGTYTNFMNLLDYAAVAVPAGRLRNGLPWGITLFGRAFTDQYLLAVAGRFAAAEGPAAAPAPARGRELIAGDRIRVVVCGAHLQGLALNHQLLDRSAALVRATTTAPGHRLYALPGGPPFRPALVRDASGRCIDVEVWEMPSTELGSFLNGIGAPLGLGKVELADGTLENAFICEHGMLDGARDITEFGGWRAYLASLSPR
ncbi:MAG: allophanate hydrolase [Panacagrimonas sp.]